MRPMLATPGWSAGTGIDPLTAVPDDPDWVHELKWDGIRLLAHARDGQLRLTTRTERDVTVAFPELQPLGERGRDLVLDGELVSLADGRPSFQRLAERVHTTSARRASQLASARPATYVVFDVLRVDGLDLTVLTWQQRRDALTELLEPHAAWQVSPVYADGRQLLTATAEQGLEGIVSKRRSSVYRAGVRSGDWLKFPHRTTASWVVGGWRPETGRSRLGALLVGSPTEGGLSYRGRVGSGLAGRAGAALQQHLADLATSDSPFVDEVPRIDAAGAHWVRPTLVVDVASLGTTGAGRLRQPSYQRPRPDLTPEEL